MRFSSGAVELAGTLWLPDVEPRCGVVMVGGSGPSDRNNDVFFPPIREHLVANGVAVLCYDKRGVGESTGSWVAATIDEFALDAAAAYDVLSKEVETVGLFGHSEGGWTVLRAAPRCPELAFVITNSTPGMSPAIQDRYAVEVGLKNAGEPAETIQSALRLYDELIEQADKGVPYADIKPRLASPYMDYFGGAPTEDEWNSIAPKLHHDPVGDIAAVRCPMLALFGSADPLVPVDASVAEFRRARPDVTIEVFVGANHRDRIGDDLAPGYLDTLTDWMVQRTH